MSTGYIVVAHGSVPSLDGYSSVSGGVDVGVKSRDICIGERSCIPEGYGSRARVRVSVIYYFRSAIVSNDEIAKTRYTYSGDRSCISSGYGECTRVAVSLFDDKSTVLVSEDVIVKSRNVYMGDRSYISSGYIS